MIDLHCHYLPGVDDGAQDLASALALIRAATANGISASVLTPHLYPGRWDNTLSRVADKFREFKRAVADAGLTMQLYLGAEVHLLPESLALLASDELLYLGGVNGKKVLLLEMPDGQIPVGALSAVKVLVARGVVPMIAHPERNKDVIRNPRKIEPFLQEGCMLQLTAASVCGLFGASANQTATKLLDAGWVTVVATDAHNLAHRPPILAEARAELARRYGSEAAMQLTLGNPAAIIDGRAQFEEVAAPGQ